MKLVCPNVACQHRYGHTQAILTYIYWVYVAWAKHVQTKQTNQTLAWSSFALTV